MSGSTQASDDVSALRDDIAALQRDVGLLLRHLKTDAATGAQDAADQFGESASQAYHQLAEESARSVEALGRRVEERPLTALMVAAAIGYAAGRLFR